MVEVAYEYLQNDDLQIDCVYKGGNASNLSSDPLSYLFLCGYAGGYRRAISGQLQYITHLCHFKYFYGRIRMARLSR